MLSLWSLCSRSLMYSSSVEESVRLKEDHMKDINSTVVRLPIFVLDSKTVAETDVVAESVEDMFQSFKCMVPCDGSWRDGDHGTHTQWQGMAFKKYISEIKRARGESMTSWINRSDEALMDMRKKLATAPGANSSKSTMVPPQIQGWLLLHTMTGGSLNIKLVEQSLLDLFTDDVLQSVGRSHGKDSGNPRKQHAFEAIEERFQRTTTTLISMRTSANTMIRTSMKTETSLQTSKSCLTLTMTWPLMMKNTTKHPLVIVRHEISEGGPCCSWVLSCCCPHSLRQAYWQRKR